MAKRILTKEEIKKINDLNNSVKGTPEYAKYHMMQEFKYKKDGKWTRWIFAGHTGNIYKKHLFVKYIKDKIYLVTETFTELDSDTVDRYEVTDTIKEVLGL